MPSPVLASSATASAADALLQAEAIVRDFCGWQIAPSESHTVTIEHRGGTELPLPSWFVTSVDSVTYEGSEVTGWRLLEAGVLKDFYAPCGAISVTYTSGYAADAVPAAVTRVVQALAQRISGNPTGLDRRIGPFSESAAVLTDDEKAALGPYRQPSV